MGWNMWNRWNNLIYFWIEIVIVVTGTTTLLNLENNGLAMRFFCVVAFSLTYPHFHGIQKKFPKRHE